MFTPATHATTARAAGRQSAAVSTVAVTTGIIGTWIASILANLVIAAIAHAAGAPNTVHELQVATFAPLTIAGVIAGAIGWAIVRSMSRDPRRVLRWLVPTVLALSMIPDVLVVNVVGTVAMVGLMAMHLAIAAIAVPVFARVLPLRAKD